MTVRLLFSCCALFAAQVVLAQGSPGVHVPIFRCNYDIALKVDDGTYEIRHQDSVRDGSYIPLDLERIQIELGIAGTSENAVELEVSVYEQPRAGGLRVLRADPTFSVPLGQPIAVSWSEGAIALDIAVAVSQIR